MICPRCKQPAAGPPGYEIQPSNVGGEYYERRCRNVTHNRTKTDPQQTPQEKEKHMPFKAKAQSQKSSDLAPAGTHQAVLVAIIDLGTHEQEFKGKKSQSHKILLVWELTAENGHPIVSREFTFSLNTKAKLRGFLESWRGKQFGEGEEIEISELLGKPCLLSIVHGTSSGGNTYAKVDNVARITKGMKVPDPSRKPVSWEIDGQKLPSVDWLPYLYGEPVVDVIKRSAEYRGIAPKQETANASAASNDDDTAPF